MVARTWRWLLYHTLRLLDQMLPGWAAPAEPRAEYLSHDSYAFWMTRHGRTGDRS